MLSKFGNKSIQKSLILSNKANYARGLMIVPLFEDNHLLVLNKPAGMLTQPSPHEKDSLETRAKMFLKEFYQKPGNVFLEAVHRLDKPVSGIVVFAKTSKALSRLNQAMREKNTRKMYWALVEGNVIGDSGVLEHHLIHDDFIAKIVPEGHPEGKKSILHYQVLERKNGRSLLEVELLTGRYHQIRVQLAAMGHPIVGDFKYGATQLYREDAIALHHRLLQIPHPITKEMMIFQTLLPP